MSQIIDLIPNLQKVFLFIKKINDSIKDDKLSLDAEPNEIFDAIESFNREKNSNIEKIKSNKDNIESLKVKIFQLNQDIPKVDSEVSELSKRQEEIQKNLEIKKKELEEIQSEKEKFKGEYDKKEQLIEDLKSELNNSWKKVEEKTQDISKAEEKIIQEINALKLGYNQILTKKEEELNSKIKEIEVENEQEYKKCLEGFKPFKVKTKAINLLIRNRMINSELFNFISALEKDKPMELSFICQTLNYDPQKAEKIIKKMIAEGGPVNFNEKNGLITLQKEVEFKR
ncbi:MAG: coiled-coil domain-containing protein [Promethearchaeota archaeon]